MARLWFASGGIPDAIAESRKTSRLFVVYISGDDENSHKMDDMWEDERVHDLCKETCVSLKLGADSAGCKQFSAIYPVLAVPSAYFIDTNGKIVEALAFQETTEEFVAKIETVTEPYRRNAPEQAGSSQSQENKNPDPQNPVDSTETAAGSESISAKETTQKPARKTGRRPVTIEDKVEDEVKEETKQEKERRELSKNLQKLKEAQREAKIKQDIEERKRNKLEEKEARERVKRQIEQDKRDRAARFQQEKNERIQTAAKTQLDNEEEKQKELERQQETRHLHARLKFLMPDGSTLVNQFDSSDVLQSAATFIISQNYPQLTSDQSFNLSVAFPRKILPHSDYPRTFAELGLTPSASLVVLPCRDMKSTSSSSAAFGLWSFLLFLLMIPGRIFMFLWNIIAGQPNTQEQATSSPAGTAAAASSHQPSAQRGTDNSPADLRRRGNMTRLRDVKPDDDDSATWNGNSTQQM